MAMAFLYISGAHATTKTGKQNASAIPAAQMLLT